VVERGIRRRLAAILAADVVGYSRLMGEDEAGTHGRLKALRQELLEPRLADHRGRIVKLTGDGVLVEFASVVDAVTCAVEIQVAVAERNVDLPEAHRLEFRVGVNLGDVIIEDDDIYGDGVNVAARLEGLARPGAVCISDLVHQMVHSRVEVRFEDLGERRVKNIALPVRVWQWSTGARAVLPATPTMRRQSEPAAATAPEKPRSRCCRSTT
jgi:class 3 adenylate cyclase